MPIEVANPIDDLDLIDEDSFTFESDEGEGTEYNMRELMDQIYAERDLILTIPADQVPVLKKGLITRKGKDNVKLKSADIATAQDVLSFLVTPTKKNGVVQDGLVDVRVKLGPKKSVRVLEIRKPNDEF